MGNVRAVLSHTHRSRPLPLVVAAVLTALLAALGTAPAGAASTTTHATGPAHVPLVNRAALSDRPTTTAAAHPAATPRPADATTPPTGPIGPGTGYVGTKPVDSYAKAIRETVWVDTGRDTDGDGKPDRVAVDIVRPSEPAARGERVPVIMDASPYYSCCGRGNESQVTQYDANGDPISFPLYYDNYFVPRGYAVVLVELGGTDRSQGCADVGGPADVGSAKAVIDWLNGRATAYTTRDGGTKTGAGWANGKVGMIGKSYDGSIANGVAATGVQGLKTIVPIASISSWYDYYFSQGAARYDSGPDLLAQIVEYLPSDPDATRCLASQEQLAANAPRTGDWTAAWQQRDYVADAAKVKASVFVVNGMQDTNVGIKNFDQWWNALAAHGVQRKIWLSQTSHVDPFDYRRADFVDTLHAWFDHYLMGVGNGVQNQPMADIERTPDHWVTSASWPAPHTVTTPLALTAGAAQGLGGLTAGAPAPGGRTFTDDPNKGEDDWAAAATTAEKDKVSFLTGPLTAPLRISGDGTVTVTASSSTASAHLSAVLVDLGPSTIRNYEGDFEGITEPDDAPSDCWGESTADDSACYLETGTDLLSTDHVVFNRGWADLGHYRPVPAPGVALTPGKPYTVTINLGGTDHVVPAGHRLAVIVAGTDDGYLTAPDSTPTLTLDLAHSHADLPVVGGAAAFTAATRRP